MSHKLAFLAVLLQSSIVFAVPCSDIHRFCPVWANIGACQTNRDYMGRNCAKSCGCERINPPSDESSTTQTTTTTTETTTEKITETTTEAITTIEVVETSASSGTSSEESTETTVATTLSETSTAAESTAATTDTTTISDSPSTTEAVSTRPSAAAPTCGLYHQKDNTDLAGVMLERVRASSFDACCSKCDETAGCDGFSFFRRICYLKTKLQGTFPKASRTTFIRKQPVRPNQCSDFAATQANLDLAGILVKPPMFAEEQQDCCNACATVPECEGFSYFQNFCYLKGQLQGTYPKSGCTVQVKGSARRLRGDEFSSGLWV